MTKIKNLFKKNPNKIRESKLDIGLNIVNIIMLVLYVIVICVPLLNFFSLAFNNGAYNVNVTIFPVKPTVESFVYVLTGKEATRFWTAFGNSVMITVIITIVSNLVEAMAAYPLSKRDCPLREAFLMYFIVTMLFSAGIIPIYMLMRMFNLLDNIWSVVLISISNVTHLLYFKTFFEGIPTDIEEAARLDGATDLQLFFRIIVPMSLPIIGSCCFFSLVGTWNGYGSAMLFISQSAWEQHPLAYYIYIMIQNANAQKDDAWLLINQRNVQSAAMVLSIVPILLMYPYVVRYIKSGLQIGSVKG